MPKKQLLWTSHMQQQHRHYTENTENRRTPPANPTHTHTTSNHPRTHYTAPIHTCPPGAFAAMSMSFANTSYASSNTFGPNGLPAKCASVSGAVRVHGPMPPKDSEAEAMVKEGAEGEEDEDSSRRRAKPAVTIEMSSSRRRACDAGAVESHNSQKYQRKIKFHNYFFRRFPHFRGEKNIGDDSNSDKKIKKKI